MEFSLNAMEHLTKSQGDKRVSKPAKEELRQILEQFTRDLAEEATAEATKDGYKTVRGKHVKEALK